MHIEVYAMARCLSVASWCCIEIAKWIELLSAQGLLLSWLLLSSSYTVLYGNLDISTNKDSSLCSPALNSNSELGQSSCFFDCCKHCQLSLTITSLSHSFTTHPPWHWASHGSSATAEPRCWTGQVVWSYTRSGRVSQKLETRHLRLNRAP